MTSHRLFSIGLLSLCVFVAHAHISQHLLTDALNGFEKVASFLAEDYSSVNVDCVFGIRLGEGSLNQSVEDCRNPQFRCPEDLRHTLERLNRWTEAIVSKATPYIEALDPAYYNRFASIINHIFYLPYRIQFLGTSASPKGDNSNYDESMGDACFSRLLGTYVDPKTSRTLPKCTIPDECWHLMSHTGKKGYAITHQLLYFMFAENFGCRDVIEHKLKPMGVVSLGEHRRNLCGKIYTENVLESGDGQVEVKGQDLFTEQSLLCGLLGFGDFYSEKNLKLMLSWQHSNGCFGKPEEKSRVGNLHNGHRAYTDEEQMMSRIQEEAKKISHASATGRKLLREKEMGGGCHAHYTGLSFGLLGGYIRFYVNTLYGPTRLY